MYDIDYEIYKYINELADQYVETDELLKRNHLTFDEAQQQAKQFKETFYALLEKYSISSQNLVVICYELMEHIRQQPDNHDFQYLYLCVMTDFCLLVRTNPDPDEEQKIRNYLRQQELIRELTKFWESQTENIRKYQELLEYLKKPIKIKNTEYSEETEFLYQLTIQHTFLYESVGNVVYKDNLNALVIYINSDEKLIRVKPYIIFAVLARKTGLMQKREHFMPNLKALFKYQDYNIYKDNGKNFNLYQSELELYDHLQRSYIDEEDNVDMELCDFCFANLSPLSEWYYMNCEPNEDIPMSLKRKIQTVMPKSFPDILSRADYETMNEDELLIYGDAAGELQEKMLQTAEKFIKI
jgi:hypothetical protein